MHESRWMVRVICSICWILTVYFGLGQNPANALPADRFIQLKPGSGRFAKSPPGSWQAHSQDGSIATATVFDTQEIFIEAHKAGTTLLLLANMKLRAVLIWQISVSSDPTPIVAPTPAENLVRVCHCTQQFKCRIKSAACTRLLHQYLQNTHLTTSQIQLLYTPETLKALSIELNKQINKAALGKIELSFSGVNLRLKGEIEDTQTWRRLMLLLYQNMVGKLFLDDQLTIHATDEHPSGRENGLPDPIRHRRSTN